MHSAETAMKVRHRTFVNRLSPEPEFPWQKAVLDYFEDAALKYLEEWQSNDLLVKTCRNLFAQFGVPEELSFDGDLLSMDMNGNDS